MVLIFRSNAICTSIDKSKFVMCLMKPRKLFQIMDRKYLPLKKNPSPPKVIARLPIMINKAFFLSFELSEEKMPLESRCQLNCMLLPLMFGLKALPQNQSLALWEMPVKICRSKWVEFQKFDFGCQPL